MSTVSTALDIFLKQHQFLTRPPEVRPCISLGVAAEDGQGKTRFLSGMPKPLLLFDIDGGLEGVIDPETPGVTVCNFNDILPWDRYWTQEDCTPAWERFSAVFWGALRSGVIRSIGVDTETALYEMFRLHHFGKTEEVLPKYYVETNRDYSTMLKAPKHQGVNAAWTRRLSDEYATQTKVSRAGKEYEASVATGRKKISGFKHFGYEMTANILLQRNPMGQHSLTFMKARPKAGNQKAMGTTLIGDQINFPTVANLVYPQVEYTAWL